MATPDPQKFADDWVRAWIAHDVEAARVLPDTGGVVRGKDALRQYWTTAFASLPDLHFDIIAVYRGESTLVINYATTAASWSTRC